MPRRRGKRSRQDDRADSRDAVGSGTTSLNKAIEAAASILLIRPSDMAVHRTAAANGTGATFRASSGWMG